MKPILIALTACFIAVATPAVAHNITRQASTDIPLPLEDHCKQLHKSDPARLGYGDYRGGPREGLGNPRYYTWIRDCVEGHRRAGFFIPPPPKPYIPDFTSRLDTPKPLPPPIVRVPSYDVIPGQPCVFGFVKLTFRGGSVVCVYDKPKFYDWLNAQWVIAIVSILLAVASWAGLLGIVATNKQAQRQVKALARKLFFLQLKHTPAKPSLVEAAARGGK